jgi:hypothetical protein
VTHQRKTAADYGQLSLFEEKIPEWLQPVEEPSPSPAGNLPTTPAQEMDDEDDLDQFTAWLQQGKQSTPPLI